MKVILNDGQTDQAGLLFGNENGFSLIEALIAMAVLGIGLLAIANLQFVSIRNNKTGNTFSQAVSLARAQIELIKSGDIADSSDILNPATFPATTSDSDNPMDENGNPGGIYTRSWTVDAYLLDTDNDGVGDTETDLARKVTVTVSFPFAGDGTRSVSLTSVVTGGGI